jgi:hypothetical protein
MNINFCTGVCSFLLGCDFLNPGTQDQTIRITENKITDQLLEIVGGRLSDGVHVVDEPGHAQAVEFLVEEVDPELT